MVEFALVLPLLLLMLYGTIELARLAFIFSSASNASRAAARYGAASGMNSQGIPYYQDCEGMRDVVNKSAFISEYTDINITYDRGVNRDGTQIPITGIDPSPSNDSCPIDDISVRNGDRIIVQVSTSYEPIVSIVPLDPLEVVSSSARTFLISIPIFGSALPKSFAAESSTPSRAPTKTPITPPTTVFVPPTDTFTPLPPALLTIFAASPTPGLPPTATFTPSRRPPPTYTASVTPTAIICTGLSGVSHGRLTIIDNVMQMQIFNNTNHVLSTTLIYVEWNHDTGHQQGGTRSLHLQQITLGDQIWNEDIYAPSKYIQGFYPRIPIGESMIRFAFNQSYDFVDGTERIVISLGTTGCEGYPIDSSR